MTNLNLENFEENLQKRINSQIDTYFSSNSQIQEAMEFALTAPGKRVRPLLIYLVGDIYNIPLERLDSLALASEIIHTYSLVHDDLPCMDDDDLRRGQPTLHKKYSESTAVLAGDAMQSLAVQIILEDEKLSNELKVSIISLLMKNIGYKGMILGQEQDISFEKKSVSKEEIIQMNYLKTGLLIEFCILAPLLIAEIEKNEWNKIAKNVGIAFQLVDDLHPYMYEYGYKMFFTSTIDDETVIFDLNETDDQEKAMKMLSLPEVINMRKEAGVDLESQETLSTISKHKVW